MTTPTPLEEILTTRSKRVILSQCIRHILSAAVISGEAFQDLMEAHGNGLPYRYSLGSTGGSWYVALNQGRISAEDVQLIKTELLLITPTITASLQAYWEQELALVDL